MTETLVAINDMASEQDDNNMAGTPRLQKLYRDLSKWSLMKKYYEAKEVYYSGHSTTMTDLEFDDMEASIIVIHGEEFIKQWGCVGHDINQHKAVNRLYQYTQEFIEVAVEIRCGRKAEVITSLEELI